jgi:poly(3-hydroxybutyrate) depolymerase
MTVEGENDDITGSGQCSAALELCTNIPAARKARFECPEAGHYGIFNGSRFRREIAPRVAAFLRMHGARHVLEPARPVAAARQPAYQPLERPTRALRPRLSGALADAA